MSTSESQQPEDRPECRVPATVDPAGLLRFEVSEEQAHQIYEQLKAEYEEAEQDDFVPVRFVMDRDAYAEVVDGLETLQSQLPQVGIKHVHLAHEPAYGLTVVMDAEQIRSTVESNAAALEQSGDEDTYSQEFHVSKNAAILVIRQLEEAFDGASNPVDAINIDEIRNSVS